MQSQNSKLSESLYIDNVSLKNNNNNNKWRKENGRRINFIIITPPEKDRTGVHGAKANPRALL